MQDPIRLIKSINVANRRALVKLQKKTCQQAFLFPWADNLLRRWSRDARNQISLPLPSNIALFLTLQY